MKHQRSRRQILRGIQDEVYLMQFLIPGRTDGDRERTGLCVRKAEVASPVAVRRNSDIGLLIDQNYLGTGHGCTALINNVTANRGA